MSERVTIVVNDGSRGIGGSLRPPGFTLGEVLLAHGVCADDLYKAVKRGDCSIAIDTIPGESVVSSPTPETRTPQPPSQIDQGKKQKHYTILGKAKS